MPLSRCHIVSSGGSPQTDRPCYVDHGETTMMIARPRWRLLVDGMLSGASLIVRGWWLVGREKSLSFDTDTVMLESVTLPSSRVSGVPSPHASERTGGNPRTCPGSSVVVVIILREGAAWYAMYQDA